MLILQKDNIDMNITILQQDIVWANPEANHIAASQAIDNAPKSDLYVLPEMFSTGFAMTPEDIAESDNGVSLKWMKSKSAEINAAICGSVAVKTDDGYRNRLYFVTPDGEVFHYDKRHLFCYGGEHKHYCAGEDRVIVNYLGIRILLLICYDLRFPKWSRNNEDYDIAIYVANWPIGRIEAWNILLKARAIENQCYVIGVNRVGNTDACKYSGSSAIIDPYGKTIAECTDYEVSSASAKIDMEMLEKFRMKFPVLKDRDM